MNQYNATYNLQGTSETSALSSNSGAIARSAASELTSRTTLSQDVSAISAAIEYENTLETPDQTTISQSKHLPGTSGTPLLSSNSEEPEREADSVSITTSTVSQDAGTISTAVDFEDESETPDPSVFPSLSLTARSDTLFLDANNLSKTAQTMLSRSTNS